MPPNQKLNQDCSNPACKYYYTAHKANSPMKCARCKSANYCNKDCQKAHWPRHKEFCKVWAETSAETPGEIPIAKIKKKMAHLIWLVRGMPDYVDYLFKEYLYRKDQGLRGCMEFEFDKFEDLFAAIHFIEKQPVTEERLFCAMPGTPSFQYVPGEGNMPQKLKIRKVKAGQEVAFVKTVDDYMHFTENENRPNLQLSMDLAGNKRNLFVISVSCKLQGTYSTHIYDFIYRNFSWYPEQ